LGRTPEQAWEPFIKSGFDKSLVPFVDAGDASVSTPAFEISALDCLRGLSKAMSLGWYSFSSFDAEAYEKNYKMTEGDMNWIIPGHIMALSSPVTPHLFKGEGTRP
jgi:cell division cycle 14